MFNNSNIFLLIKSALTGQKFNLQLSEDEISNIFDIAKKHQIIALVHQGMCDCEINCNLISKYEDVVCSNIIFSNGQMYAVSKISKLFTDNKIDFAVLKGSILKGLYPQPQLRLMGDIDILIRYEQYPKIKKLLLQNGYIEGEETDHELQWHNNSNINLELHKRLIPTYNYDYYNYYGDGWNFFKPSPENPYMFKMSNEDMLIYLFTHLCKHYRDGGIGLRHFIDLYVYLNHYKNLDGKYIKNELEKLNLYEFYLNVIKTLSVWFDNKSGNRKTDLITKRVFESGSFGNKNNNDVANAVRKSKNNNSVLSTKFLHLFFLVFMPYKLMKKKYSTLKKHPILLPAFWVRRWFEAIAFKRQNIKRQTERAKKINVKDITAYQNDLDAVGLPFLANKTNSK